ncbi:CDP-alcohol phosphatidyltransferase family protein [Mycoplasma wenyonii]|uniref:CDP-alcohol phosphatidyltransferase family protein n=1 Tax=Mycoplasma wenyonii TaxID=65123 RepID=UPI0021AC4DAE|nr:CDP-alcohol phosphatidyltransferase family protein [Mycoplasma wenyonii]
MLTRSRFVLGFFSVFFYFLFIVKRKNTSSNGLFSSDTIPFLQLSFVFLILSIITDYFDGALARKWKCQSKFGAVYDPLADKLLVSAFLVLFGFAKAVHWIIPVLSLAREITVERIRYKLKKIGIWLKANTTAKKKTAIQFAGIILGFLVTNSWGKEVLNIFFLFSLLFSFKSLTGYLKIYWDSFIEQ